jgi:hypothetical protein
LKDALTPPALNAVRLPLSAGDPPRRLLWDG